MNPMMILQIKEKIDTFKKEHPKMLPFFKTINQKALEEGSILEIKATSVDGVEYVSNIKVTANDIEMIRIISGLGGVK